MPYTDSIDKIVSSYFAAITRQEFVYKSTWYKPKTLIVSPLLFRGYTCPEKCGGCCPRFSLDYLPIEELPYRVQFRHIEFHGRKVLIYTDLQDDHDNHHCRNLNHENGRCGIHGKQPFSCDFELIRCIHHQDHTVLTQKLFGRGWAFLRTDGERGARCEMTPVTKETTLDVVRKLIRLKQWADHFKLEHCLDVVIKWAEKGPHIRELVIVKDSKTVSFTRKLTEVEEPLVQIGE